MPPIGRAKGRGKGRGKGSRDTGTPSPGASKTSSPPKGKGDTWCKGKIWFNDKGCIYIDDKTLANAVTRRFYETGKLCVTIRDPFSPGYELDILCGC